jgi:hypothetical protein
MVANPFSWSTTNSSNATVEAISIAEGMPSPDINNALRGVMVGVKEALDLRTGAKTTGGSATVMTLTTGVSLPAYAAGQAFLVESGFTTTGALTLDVDTVGARDVTTGDGAALVKGSMTAGGMYLLAYESDGDDFILMNPDAASFPGASKAWCHVSMSGSFKTDRDSFNVSSSTDNAKGKLTINYTTAFNSVYYAIGAITGLVDTSIDESSDGRHTALGNRAVGSCQIQCFRSDDYKDPDSYHFVARGNQD